MALSESRTGANIDITAATSVSETGHFFTGTFFTEDFTVGDRIRVESTDYFAVRTITNISNNTSMIVDNGLESTNTAAVYYVFASGGGDGIVEYENSDGSRFVGYKEVSLKIVLLSSNPVRVYRYNMKETEDSFVRDNNNTGCVLNTDNNALKAYKLKKQKNKEIDNLKEEVKDIKNMLTLILENMK